MTDRVPVFAALHAYRVAVASFPSRAHLAGNEAGAIVVVDGATDWWDTATAAVTAGASAIVVAEPGSTPPEVLGDAVQRFPVPIIVSRSRLRHDVASLAVEHRAGIQPRVVVAECRSPEGPLPAMVRDAVGWMRELSDTPLRVAASSVGTSGGTALLRPAAEGPVRGSMTITVTRPEGTLLRVTALGETTTELEFDELLGRSELVTSTSEGRLVAPTRFEARERVALRRALEAVAGQRRPDDLINLIADEKAARDVLRDTDFAPSVVL